jgi:hypothetical protein
MDITKVTAAIASAKTELGNAITAERKVLADPKADVAAVTQASRALLVAGRIDTILTAADARISKSLKKLAPRAKKAKKAAAAK